MCWPGAKMAAALPSFSDKTSAWSGDKHKLWRGTEEEASQITTATIQGFGGARGSHGHCLALVSYFVHLLKVFFGCGWHFSEQRRGKKHFKCFCKVSLLVSILQSLNLSFPEEERKEREKEREPREVENDEGRRRDIAKTAKEKKR